MKKTHLILVTVLTFFTLHLTAQTLDVKWSEPMKFDKATGHFSEYLNCNSKTVFTKYVDKQFGKPGLIKIVAHDKNTLKKVAEFELYSSKNKKMEDMRYYKTIIFENSIYVFWYKATKNLEELFVQSLDGKLKTVNALKKVYEVKSNKDDDKRGETFVMGNKKVGEKIVIGAELPASKGEKLEIEYKVLDNKFAFVASNKVSLPGIVRSKSNTLSSSYTLGDDGNLHIETKITLSRKEAKEKDLKKGESRSHAVYSMVNLMNGEIKSIPIKFNNKNIFDFDFVEDANTIKLFGFFCDLTKDKDGDDIHGVFYGMIDPKTYQLIGEFNFTYFTKSQLDALFGERGDGKDRAGIFASKKDKKSEEESMSSNYIIEQVQSVDKDNLVLFCSIMHNYTVQVCTTTTSANGASRTTCRNEPRCNKSNVTAIKINKDGKIEWATNIDRSYTYHYYSAYDLKVINKDNKFYAVYASSYDEVGKADPSDSKSKSKTKPTKGKKDAYDNNSDRLEYAVFDYATGKAEKKNYIINKAGTEKKEKKRLNAVTVEVIDNDFYSYSKRSKSENAPCGCFCLGIFYKTPPFYLAKFNVIK